MQCKANPMRQAAWLLGMVLIVAACGGTSTGDGEEGVAAPGAGDSTAHSGEVSSEGGEGTANEGRSAAMARLVVGDITYTWEGNEWTYCEIGGLFPANAEFQTEQDKRAGNWVQFIDRGDGGINFSAILEGEEYAGTGSGEGADEITSSGFTYTGTVNRGGQVLDASLEVSC